MLLTPRQQVWTCFYQRFSVSQALIPVESVPSRPHLNFGANGILRSYVTAEWASFRSSIVSLANQFDTETSGKFRQWVMSWPRINNETRRQAYTGLLDRFQLWSFFVAVQLSGQRIVRRSSHLQTPATSLLLWKPKLRFWECGKMKLRALFGIITQRIICQDQTFVA